jgi:hypothetical protein
MNISLRRKRHPGSIPGVTSIFVQVAAPHFVAAIVLEDDVCTEAAPILKYAIGKRREWLRDYFRSKGWKAIVVKEHGWSAGGPAASLENS